jgi:inorganic pyrophosphatase/exopolyphosphatase
MFLEEKKRYILRNGYICRPTAAYQGTFHSCGIYGYCVPHQHLIFNKHGECLTTLDKEYDEHPFDVMAEAIEHVHYKLNDSFGIHYLYDIDQLSQSFKKPFDVVITEIIDGFFDSDWPTYAALKADNQKLRQRIAELEKLLKEGPHALRKEKYLTDKRF